jgi:hypothetical protein
MSVEEITLETLEEDNIIKMNLRKICWQANRHPHYTQWNLPSVFPDTEFLLV